MLGWCLQPSICSQFAENVLLDGLYWEYWYDTVPTETMDNDRNILYENRLLGVPRLRQVGRCWIYIDVIMSTGDYPWKFQVMVDHWYISSQIIPNNNSRLLVRVWLCCRLWKIIMDGWPCTLSLYSFPQLRVKNDSCEIPDEFTNSIKQCYASYSQIAEDDQPFGINTNSSAYVLFQSYTL